MKEKILVIFATSIFIFAIATAFLFSNNTANSKKNTENDNENPFFIKQQILYSSIMPKSNSFYESNWNLSISQYTDVAIYISQKSSILTDSNTIKSLYIDKVSYKQTPILGKPSLYYQNPTKFATDFIASDYLIDNHLNYNILNFENNENYNY